MFWSFLDCQILSKIPIYHFPFQEVDLENPPEFAKKDAEDDK